MESSTEGSATSVCTSRVFFTLHLPPLKGTPLVEEGRASLVWANIFARVQVFNGLAESLSDSAAEHREEPIPGTLWPVGGVYLIENKA
jgi:hypothetical protein